MTQKKNSTKNQAKFLNGRLNQGNNQRVMQFNSSVHFDKRLALVDIQGSKAHTTMLAEQGIITSQEKAEILKGLASIQKDIQAGEFVWQEELEDVHMNIEAALIERIGEVGKKLHTARSRNDQVATDLRLFLRASVDEILEQLSEVQTVLLDLAERNHAIIMPGYTHLQSAQPITFGHHLMAWFEMFYRDSQRLQDCRRRINQMPLGSAALAGTSFPINRERTAELLNFEGICRNSLDAVSDRDFAIEFLQCMSSLMIHLSRICEELIIWNTLPFSLVDFPDIYCTGSSIMPQKKNPDIPELIRGKAARVFAAQSSLLMLMKSQPLAYNKDNQEDKEPVFDTIDTVQQCLQLFTEMMQFIQPNEKNMRQLANQGYATATDLADYLVAQGLAFRDAYQKVGEIVREAIEQSCSLSDLPLEKLQQIEPKIQANVYEFISLEASVNARNHIGGTAPQQVLKAVAYYRKG